VVEQRLNRATAEALDATVGEIEGRKERINIEANKIIHHKAKWICTSKEIHTGRPASVGLPFLSSINNHAVRCL
jgi:hypothetical protein